MKDSRGHGSNSRGGGNSMPLAGHSYHTKSDAELHYIVRDASAAAKNAQGMGDAKGEGKYLDQVNDASSVMGYRSRGGERVSSPAAGIASAHGISTDHLEPGVGSGGRPQDFNFRIGGANVKVRANNQADAHIKAQAKYGR